MRAVYMIGSRASVVTLGNQPELWKAVCRMIVHDRLLLQKAEYEHGIDFTNLESKWVGIQKHFYSYLLKKPGDYFVEGSDEFNYFKKWKKM